VDGDRRISTRFGLLDVDVRVGPQGSVRATLSKTAVTGAIATDEDEVVERLRAAIERWGSDPAATLRGPVREGP
jgi:hypothetical protein